MQTTLRVRRYDPEGKEPNSRLQEYKLDVPHHFTVLDALIQVREEVDPSLALRCSCRAAICGSCAMRVNGHAQLGCKTKIVDLAPNGEPVTVEPMTNMRVVKDLVVDMNLFWGKIRAVAPYLQTKGPEPEDEYIAPNEAMVSLTGVMACIMCGACVSDCTVLEVDKNFLGPAALAKAYRFLGDPRDQADNERLKSLNEYGGVWDCTRCYECVQVCPKGVAPMERIMVSRELVMQAGFNNTYGARHIKAFANVVEKTGWLDETKLAMGTFGIFNMPKLVGNIPFGLRMLRRGKVPLFHHKRPGAENIGRIFKKLEFQKTEAHKA